MNRKKLLFHICCAPCFIAPYEQLQEEGELDVMGFWFNPNIHPYQEYLQRLTTLKDYAEKNNISLIIKDEYPLEEWLQKVVFREKSRCRICYYERLRYTAIVAAKGNFDFFTTTLLYSKFQNHQLIKETGETLGKEYGVKFYYRDFREHWKDGIARSREEGMYRQQYCGCIYSEKERYINKISKEKQ